jgi:hypothetical protein
MVQARSSCTLQGLGRLGVPGEEDDFALLAALSVRVVIVVDAVPAVSGGE